MNVGLTRFERLAVGGPGQDDNLVFCSPTGTALDAANVRRAFRLITTKAGIGEDWTVCDPGRC